MEKTLQMVFQNAAGKNVTMNLSNVKDNVTATEIKGVMEMIISKNVLSSTGGDLKSIVSASVVSRDVEAITVK